MIITKQFTINTLQPYILGIDIGTGSIKSVAVTVSGETFSSHQVHFNFTGADNISSEQNPELIWQTFLECIQVHVQKISRSPVAICLSSVMHSLISVDENGMPLTNMFTWADIRSAPIAEELRASRSGEDIYRKTGTPVHPMSPLCKIIWLLENNKDLFSRTSKFISIKELVWYRLFNEFKVDIAIASATGLFDIETNQWYNKSLEIAGIGGKNLSTPVPTSYYRNDCNAAICSILKIDKDVTFIIGASDGCLANIGSFTFNKDEAAITIGTSGAVRKMNPEPLYNFHAMTFNYKLEDDLFVCGGPISNGGNVLQWYLNTFLNNKEINSAVYESLFEEISKVNPGAGGLIFLPYLNGERAPHWDATSCGAFFGIKTDHVRAQFSRAVIEGICYALNDVLKTVDNDNDITQLNVSGGFVVSKIWMQILADVTGKRICLVHVNDASAAGAAYLGLKAMRFIKDYRQLITNNKMEFLEPRPDNHKLYHDYFRIYRELYTSLKGSMQDLNNINLSPSHPPY